MPESSSSLFERLVQDQAIRRGFQAGVDRELAKLGDDLAKSWMRRARATLKKDMERAAVETLQETLRSIQSGNASGSTFSANGFSGLFASVLRLGFSQFFGSRTRTRSVETERSRQEGARFMESRSQEQARLAQQVVRAQRNL